MRRSPALKYYSQLIDGPNGLLSRGLSESATENYGGPPRTQKERASLAHTLNKFLKVRFPEYAVRSTHAAIIGVPLRTYKVPRSPLTKKSEEERDRVLSDDEISKISALAINNELADALFFFQIALITACRMAEIRRMKWEESSERFGTVKLYSSKTKKWRTIKAPAAATLIAQRRVQERNAPMVIDRPDHWIRGELQTASESVGVVYGQQVPGGWCPHDLRHTCLTNLALAGVPLNGIKEYAGHSSIVETQRYLKFMPESIELAAMVTSRLAERTRATAESQPGANAIEDPDDGGPAPPTSRGR